MGKSFGMVLVMGTGMKFQLGQRLLDGQVISPEQLQRGLEHKKAVSGKIGTHLVELGYLTLGDLEKNLGQVFGLPIAQDRDLERLDYFCKKNFPLTTILGLQALPFRRSDQKMLVAITQKEMAAQVRQVFSDLAKVPVDLFVISEIKFHYYVYRHFQHDLDARIRRIYFQFKRDYVRQENQKSSVEVSQPDSAVVIPKLEPAVESLGIRPLAADEQLTDSTDEHWYECYLNPAPLTPPDMQTPQPSAPANSPEEFEPEFATI